MIARLFAPQFIVLYVFAASALLVHFRGRERLRFARQLGDHSTFLAPLNALMYLFSAVPNEPLIATERFPDVSSCFATSNGRCETELPPRSPQGDGCSTWC